MSLPPSGAVSRSAGLISAIAKQTKLVNLKGVRRVTVEFDPFHERATEMRKFLFYINGPKVIASNPSCPIKTEIVCDRRPGTVTFQLIPQVAEQLKLKSVVLNGENLSALELLTLTNKYVSANAPVEEPVAVVQTKSAKKVGKKR